MDLGGAPDDYELRSETVVSKSDASKSLTFARAAQRAIELGGKYSGQEAPEDINPMTQRSVAAIAGSGLVGVAKDNLERNGTVPGLCTAFIQIELDTETGKFEVIDFLNVGDVGTVLHPQSLRTQLLGGGVQGFGMAMGERHVFDPQLGLPANKGFHNGRLPTYLEMPRQAAWHSPDIADPQNPAGAKGVGEPAMGSSAAALLCAISDALGGHLFNRVPVTPDLIINAAAGRPQSYEPLSQNTQ